jgi:hypothetical protein
MHYKDGTPARVGDIIKVTYEEKDGDEVVNRSTRIGQLVRANAQPSGSCGGAMLPLIVVNEGRFGRSVSPTYPSDWCVTIQDCEKVA